MGFGLAAANIARARGLLGSYGQRREVCLRPGGVRGAVTEPSLGRFMERSFFFAGYDAHARRGSLMRILALSLAICATAAIFKFVWLIIGVPVLCWLEAGRLRRRAFSRAQEFERDYPALLVSLASGVRTGMDPLVALSRSVDLFNSKSQIQTQLLELKNNLEHGMSEEQAIFKFAVSIEHPDIQLFRTAFMLARKEGSSLAECLQRLARVTRQRQSFRRRVRSAVAMQKMSAFGIALCTLVIGGIQGLTNPRAFILAFQDPVGMRAICFGLTLVSIGLVWMLSLTRSKL